MNLQFFIHSVRIQKPINPFDLSIFSNTVKFKCRFDGFERKINMNAKEFREFGYAAVDFIAEYMENVHERFIY